MARKDSEKDADRPHYYSQFWLDVAAGRRVIGAPRTDEPDTDEEFEPTTPQRSTRSVAADSDGYHETIVHPQVEPELEEDADEYSTPDVDTLDTVDDFEEEALPAFGANDDDIPDVEIAPQLAPQIADEEEEAEEPEEEDEDFYDEEEEDEEEEDTWSARGRKKPRPGRQTKLPSKPASKRPKREPRRGF